MSQMRNTARLDFVGMRRWVLALCVATFDLELGQAIESVYPPLELSQAERKCIAFSAFPDSNSTAHTGDSVFSFRFRSGDATRQIYNSNTSLNDGTVDTDGFTYAFVFFRQQKDGEIRRGFFQKSLIILTPHPWPGIFNDIVTHIGESYMDAIILDRPTLAMAASTALMESIAAEIAAWPAPPTAASSTTSYQPLQLTLPLLGRSQTYSIPPTPRFPQSLDALNPPACPAILHTLFSSSLDSLWSLWEIMVVCEPILVVADTPAAASDAVWCLLELVKPLQWAGDFRPNLALQDPDFSALSGKNISCDASGIGGGGGLLVGVTNPQVRKGFDSWPHVVKVVRNAGAISASSPVRAGEPMGRGSPIVPSTLMVTPSRNYSGSSSNSSSPRSTETNSPLAPKRITTYTPPRPHLMAITYNTIPHQVYSFTSKHKPTLTKDKKLLKDLLSFSLNTSSSSTALVSHRNAQLDNTLRRHFSELTDRFLAPLGRHFDASCLGTSPAGMRLDTLRRSPDIKPFRMDQFLASIDANPPLLNVTNRRALRDLYTKFLRSPNFASWLAAKIVDVHRGWRQWYLRVLCVEPAEVLEWCKERGRVEVDVVELLMRVRDEIERAKSLNDLTVLNSDQLSKLTAIESVLVSVLSTELGPGPARIT